MNVRENNPNSGILNLSYNLTQRVLHTNEENNPSVNQGRGGAVVAESDVIENTSKEIRNKM